MGFIWDTVKGITKTAINLQSLGAFDVAIIGDEEEQSATQVNVSKGDWKGSRVAVGPAHETSTSTIRFTDALQEFSYWHERSIHSDRNQIGNVLFCCQLSWESATELVAYILSNYTRDLELLDINISDTFIGFEEWQQDPEFNLLKLLEVAGFTDIEGADAFNLIIFVILGQAIRESKLINLKKQEWNSEHDVAVVFKLLPLLKKLGFFKALGRGGATFIR